MLAYLLSGEYASASELAKAASVTPATASGHLGKLLDARFVVCEPRGRHRYYRLADAEVAHALEALALVAERDGHDQIANACATRGAATGTWRGNWQFRFSMHFSAENA
jgi:DNA-binding transcriptional ArsR family regulator